MTTKLGWLARVVAMFALGLTFAGASLAQTSTTTNTRKFEVISVVGNQLVFRDERGTNELTVPDGFRFTVDGKQLAIGDLKRDEGHGGGDDHDHGHAGHHHRNQEGVVVSVAPMSLIVKDDADGVRKRFTQAQLTTGVSRSSTRTAVDDPRRRCAEGRRDVRRSSRTVRRW
jgi:hypothetical protein